MFQAITWQDYLGSADKNRCVLDAIQRYRSSRTFRQGLEANAYFCGENLTVAGKTVLQAAKLRRKGADGRVRSSTVLKDVVGNRIGSGILQRLVIQQTQYLLGNGVTLQDQQTRSRLGTDFDRQLALMGEKALLHGVCWLYWNLDHA